MKNCTDIEQSKKLAELGIDEDTADMNYCNSSYKGKDYVGEWTLSLSSPKFAKTILGMSVTDWNTCWEVIPAWSLSAILELIPSIDKANEYYVETENHSDCHIVRYKNCWDGCIHSEYSKESLLDAAFELVVWLKENKERRII